MRPAQNRSGAKEHAGFVGRSLHMSDESDEMAKRVGDDMTLRPSIFLPASKPRRPPLSVVLADRLSITPAVGSVVMWRPW